VVWTGCFKKFLKMALRLPHIALEITFDGRDTPLTESSAFSSSPTPQAFLAPLTVALDGVAQLPLAAAFTLPRTNVPPIAPSPEACRVAMLSRSLVVFDYSRLSSSPKASQNTDMTSESATLGSSWHFHEKHRM
jgi:hypothetical protein